MCRDVGQHYGGFQSTRERRRRYCQNLLRRSPNLPVQCGPALRTSIVAGRITTVPPDDEVVGLSRPGRLLRTVMLLKPVEQLRNSGRSVRHQGSDVTARPFATQSRQVVKQRTKRRQYIRVMGWKEKPELPWHQSNMSYSLRQPHRLCCVACSNSIIRTRHASACRRQRTDDRTRRQVIRGDPTRPFRILHTSATLKPLDREDVHGRKQDHSQRSQRGLVH